MQRKRFTIDATAGGSGNSGIQAGSDAAGRTHEIDFPVEDAGARREEFAVYE